MNLKRAIKRATKQALNAQGSISQRIEYYQTGPSVYNANTSTPSRPTEAVHTIQQAWFTSFKVEEIDGKEVQPSDQRLTFYGDHLGYVPKMRDYVLDKDGVKWEVLRYKGPISGAIHILHVRRP